MKKIIKRTDLESCTNTVYNIVYFCSCCDPNGEGGHGGILIESPYQKVIESRKKFCNFCPTCGTPVNWNTSEIVEKKRTI